MGLSLYAAWAAPARAATLVLVTRDMPGEGLHSTIPARASDGTMSTQGQVRTAAVLHALSVWANALESEVPIRVGVRFDHLGGTRREATLGYGGPTAVYRDFAGAPASGTWYPSALADRLAGVDLSGSGDGTDVEIVLNSDVDGSDALGSSRFHYGLDTDPAPGDIDLVSVVVHELAHGLGVTSTLDLASGRMLFGYPDAHARRLEHHGAAPARLDAMSDPQRRAALTAGPSLRWVGPLAKNLAVYAPRPAEPGSSLTHFTNSGTPPTGLGPFHEPGRPGHSAALAALVDLGWHPRRR